MSNFTFCKQIFFLLQSVQTRCGAHPAICLQNYFTGLKRPELEVDQSPAYSTEFKNDCC